MTTGDAHEAPTPLLADTIRLRRVATVQVVIISVSLALMVVVWLGTIQLQRRRDALRAELDTLSGQLTAANQDLAQQRAALEASKRALDDNEKVLRSLKATSGSLTSELQTKIAETLETTTATERIVSNATKPRIHILYADETQAAVAVRLVESLSAQGYVVRQPKNLKGTPGKPATDMTQVRFMHLDDRPAAEEVLRFLQQQGIQHSRVSHVPDVRTPRGRVEIWFEAGTVR